MISKETNKDIDSKNKINLFRYKKIEIEALVRGHIV